MEKKSEGQPSPAKCVNKALELYVVLVLWVAVANEILHSDIPPHAVEAGFDYGLTQIELAGYVNFPTFRVPKSAYKQDLRFLNRPAECRFAFDQYFSALEPKHLVVLPGSNCGRPSSFHPVYNRTWLSPRKRKPEIVRGLGGR